MYFDPAALATWLARRLNGALELLRPDEATGRLATVASTATFSCVRALCAVRPTGAATDDVAVASDAGTLTVLRFDAARGGWTRIHCETFGKTGCRRAVPGQYLAADPRGRPGSTRRSSRPMGRRKYRLRRGLRR